MYIRIKKKQTNKKPKEKKTQNKKKGGFVTLNHKSKYSNILNEKGSGLPLRYFSICSDLTSSVATVGS